MRWKRQKNNQKYKVRRRDRGVTCWNHYRPWGLEALILPPQRMGGGETADGGQACSSLPATSGRTPQSGLRSLHTHGPHPLSSASSPLFLSMPVPQMGFPLTPRSPNPSSSYSPLLANPSFSFFIYKRHLIPTTSQGCLRSQCNDSSLETIDIAQTY